MTTVCVRVYVSNFMFAADDSLFSIKRLFQHLISITFTHNSNTALHILNLFTLHTVNSINGHAFAFYIDFIQMKRARARKLNTANKTNKKAKNAYCRMVTS